MMSSAGITLGPLATGLLQELTDDLGLSLAIVSFASLSLCMAGLVMRHGLSGSRRPEREPATTATGD